MTLHSTPHGYALVFLLFVPNIGSPIQGSEYRSIPVLSYVRKPCNLAMKPRAFKLVCNLTVCLAWLANPVWAAPVDCAVPHTEPAPVVSMAPVVGSPFGQMEFLTHDQRTLKAYYYLPTGLAPDSPLVFVMHGAGRDALNHLELFAPAAERHATVAIAIAFDQGNYPTSDEYTLGLGRNGVPYTGVYQASEWLDPGQYLYREIERVFEFARNRFGLHACGYSLVGHSAGGQFVHRLVTFMRDARLLRAVAVNSGWYTLLSRGDGQDLNYYMPYGLQGSPLTDDDMRAALAKDLVILVGENDTQSAENDDFVRGTDEANHQGLTRFERAFNSYDSAKASANRLAVRTNWRLDVIPKARHSFREVMASAAWYVFADVGAEPCDASDSQLANVLRIDEIHADPASGTAGDANHDGVRDSQDDEFVELRNHGAQALCLSGSTLGDAANSRRHVFPIGTKLDPGKALLVFGGGIPTGAFGGSLVQTASSGLLNLNNAGDSLVLANSSGSEISRISWGSAGGIGCQGECLNFDLEIDQSITHTLQNPSQWVRHSQADGQLNSPGTLP